MLRINPKSHLLGKSLFVTTIFMGTAYAAVNGLPYTPGVSLQGFTGEITQGFADAMIPLLGRPDEFFYIDPQGWFYDEDQYSASGGMGLRKLTNNAILGAYVFADYNHSENNNSFWFISPGIEALGNVFDFGANLYFPISSKTQDAGTTFASDMNNWSFVQFSGHQQIDEIFQTFESVGMGGDMEVGYRLPFLRNNSKIYLGAYYFNPQDAEHITGGTARLEVPLTNYASIGVSEGYDNVNHNTVKANLTLVMGGRKTHVPYLNLADRMVDPIHRNLDAVAGSAHTSQPISQVTQDSGTAAVFQDNLWFFSDNGSLNGPVTLASCTAERPCDFTQSNLTGINGVSPSGANLYVESGNYINLNGQVTLYNNQDVYGRSNGWIWPAFANTRPTLFGSLNLLANNSIYSIVLANDPSNPVDMGILIQDGANTRLFDDQIGTTRSDPSHAYRIGIDLGNNDNLTVKHSTINAFSNSAESPDFVGGIALTNKSNSNVLVEKSKITAEYAGSASNSAAGIFVGNFDVSQTGPTTNNHITVDHTVITAQAIGADPVANNGTIGIFMGAMSPMMTSTVTNNTLNVTNSQISVTSLENITSTIPIGVQGNNNRINSSNNILTASSANNSEFAFATGFFISGENDSLNSTKDQIFVKGQEIFATKGVFVLSGPHNISLSQDLFNLTSVAEANNSLTVVDLSNSTGGNALRIEDTQINGTITGENSSMYALQVQSPDNFITLNRSQINMTASGDGIINWGILVEDTNNSLTMANNRINLSTTGDEGDAIGVEISNSNDSIFSSSGDQITVKMLGENSFNAGWEIAGGSQNIVTIKDLNIIMTATGADTTVQGFAVSFSDNNSIELTNPRIAVGVSGDDSQVFGIYDVSSNNDLLMINNADISVTSSGASPSASGILSFFSSDELFSITNPTIKVSTSGDDAATSGIFDLVGDTNSFTIINADITVTTTGSNSDAYGVRAFFSDNDTFNIMNSSLKISAVSDNAYGLFNNAPLTNTWNYDAATFNQIQVSAPVEACKVKLGAGPCLN